VYEYDGLEAGEVAWVMGKQFQPVPAADTSYTSIVSSAVQQAALAQHTGTVNGVRDDAVDRAGLQTLIDSLSSGRGPRMPGPVGQDKDPYAGQRDDDSASSLRVAPSLGFGPDRMQRMAYTNWVEALFEQRISRQTIDLHTLRLIDDSSHHEFLDSDIAFYGRMRPMVLNRQKKSRAAARLSPLPSQDQVVSHLAGATALCVPDLAFALQVSPDTQRSADVTARSGAGDLGGPNQLQVQVPMMQGLFVMEKGPFLRTYGVEDSTVEIRIPIGERGNRTAMDNEKPRQVDVPRHLARIWRRRRSTAN